MAYVHLVIWIFFAIRIIASSEEFLSSPTILLPHTTPDSGSVKFTLQVTSGSGCYQWSSTRKEVVDIHYDEDENQECPDKVVLEAPLTSSLTKQTASILVVEKHSGSVLRSDVIVNEIHSIKIVTRTRILSLSETKVAIEVLAYDREGNVFSSLLGMRFQWNITDLTLSDVTSSSSTPIIRIIPFLDPCPKTEKIIQKIEAMGAHGSVIFLEASRTGKINLSVSVVDSMYNSHELRDEVTIEVIENLLLFPSHHLYLLPGSVQLLSAKRLIQGKLHDVTLPSDHYQIIISNTDAFHLLPSSSKVHCIRFGSGSVSIKDAWQDSSSQPKILTANVEISVVHPDAIDIIMIDSPERNSLIIGKSYHITLNLYFKSNKLSLLENALDFRLNIDGGLCEVQKNSTKNNFVIFPQSPGQIIIYATLSGYKSMFDESFVKLDRVLNSKKTFNIYHSMSATPSILYFPHVPSSWKLPTFVQHPIQVNGGSGRFSFRFSHPDNVSVSSGILNVSLTTLSNFSVTITDKFVESQQVTILIHILRIEGVILNRNTSETEIHFPISLRADLILGSDQVVATAFPPFPFTFSIRYVQNLQKIDHKDMISAEKNQTVTVSSVSEHIVSLVHSGIYKAIVRFRDKHEDFKYISVFLPLTVYMETLDKSKQFKKIQVHDSFSFFAPTSFKSSFVLLHGPVPFHMAGFPSSDPHLQVEASNESENQSILNCTYGLLDGSLFEGAGSNSLVEKGILCSVLCPNDEITNNFSVSLRNEQSDEIHFPSKAKIDVAINCIHFTKFKFDWILRNSLNPECTVSDQPQKVYVSNNSLVSMYLKISLINSSSSFKNLKTVITGVHGYSLNFPELSSGKHRSFEIQLSNGKIVDSVVQINQFLPLISLKFHPNHNDQNPDTHIKLCFEGLSSRLSGHSDKLPIQICADLLFTIVSPVDVNTQSKFMLFRSSKHDVFGVSGGSGIFHVKVNPNLNNLFVSRKNTTHFSILAKSIGQYFVSLFDICLYDENIDSKNRQSVADLQVTVFEIDSLNIIDQKYVMVGDFSNSRACIFFNGSALPKIYMDDMKISVRYGESFSVDGKVIQNLPESLNFSQSSSTDKPNCVDLVQKISIMEASMVKLIYDLSYKTSNKKIVSVERIIELFLPMTVSPSSLLLFPGMETTVYLSSGPSLECCVMESSVAREDDKSYLLLSIHQSLRAVRVKVTKTGNFSFIVVLRIQRSTIHSNDHDQSRNIIYSTEVPVQVSDLSDIKISLSPQMDPSAIFQNSKVPLFVEYYSKENLKYSFGSFPEHLHAQWACYLSDAGDDDDQSQKRNIIKDCFLRLEHYLNSKISTNTYSSAHSLYFSADKFGTFRVLLNITDSITANVFRDEYVIKVISREQFPLSDIVSAPQSLYIPTNSKIVLDSHVLVEKSSENRKYAKWKSSNLPKYRYQLIPLKCNVDSCDVDAKIILNDSFSFDTSKEESSYIMRISSLVSIESWILQIFSKIPSSIILSPINPIYALKSSKIQRVGENFQIPFYPLETEIEFRIKLLSTNGQILHYDFDDYNPSSISIISSNPHSCKTSLRGRSLVSVTGLISGSCAIQVRYLYKSVKLEYETDMNFDVGISMNINSSNVMVGQVIKIWHSFVISSDSNIKWTSSNPENIKIISHTLDSATVIALKPNLDDSSFNFVSISQDGYNLSKIGLIVSSVHEISLFDSDLKFGEFESKYAISDYYDIRENPIFYSILPRTSDHSIETDLQSDEYFDLQDIYSCSLSPSNDQSEDFSRFFSTHFSVHPFLDIKKNLIFCKIVYHSGSEVPIARMQSRYIWRFLGDHWMNTNPSVNLILSVKQYRLKIGTHEWRKLSTLKLPFIPAFQTVLPMEMMTHENDENFTGKYINPSIILRHSDVFMMQIVSVSKIHLDQLKIRFDPSFNRPMPQLELIVTKSEEITVVANGDYELSIFLSVKSNPPSEASPPYQYTGPFSGVLTISSGISAQKMSFKVKVFPDLQCAFNQSCAYAMSRKLALRKESSIVASISTVIRHLNEYFSSPWTLMFFTVIVSVLVSWYLSCKCNSTSYNLLSRNFGSKFFNSHAHIFSPPYMASSPMSSRTHASSSSSSFQEKSPDSDRSHSSYNQNLLNYSNSPYRNMLYSENE